MLLPKRVSGTETIEIQINAVQKKYYFDDYSNLRGKKILYIENSGTSYSPTNRERETTTNGYFVGVEKGKEVINRINLNVFAITSGFTLLINKILDWSKCYLEFGSTASIATGTSFIFTIHYEENPKTTPMNLPLAAEYAETVVKSTSQQKFSFGVQNNLKGKKVRYIETRYDASPNGYSGMNATVRERAYLTLVSNNKEVISKLPIRTIYEANRTNYYYFDDLIIDWEKSYVEVPTTTGLVANEAFSFNVFYVDEAQNVVRKQIVKKQLSRR